MDRVKKYAPTVVMVGGTLLLTLMLIFYWVPVVWWVIGYLLTEKTSLPKEFPFWVLTLRTLGVSILVSAASILGAYPLVLIWRLSGSYAKLTTVCLMVIPMIMGLLARNYSWIGMLSSNNTLSSMGWVIIDGQQLLYTQLSVYIVMICIFIPIAFFILIQGTSFVSKYHVDAARTLGVPDWKILFVVILPLTHRAAVLAFGLNLAMSVGYFITPRMIGGGKSDFISNAILISVNQGQFGQASVLALRFLLVMAIPVAVIAFLALRRRLMITGR